MRTATKHNWLKWTFITILAGVLAIGLVCLAACSTVPNEDKVKTVTVDVPINNAVHCKPQISLDPQKYPDNDTLLQTIPYPDAAARLKADNNDVKALMDELENVHFVMKELLEGRLHTMCLLYKYD